MARREPAPPENPPSATAPRRTLTVWHAASVCVGMVIGAGIFKSAPLAAMNVTSEAWLLAAWAFGGAMSLAGALCFAEMAAAFPDPGGDYYFLRKAYGTDAGFLFAWSRFAVIHTGSMALLAFSFGDYLGALVGLGPHGSAVVAATVIALLAALNLAGLRFGIGTQLTLTVVAIIGLVSLIGAGAWLAFGGLTPGPTVATQPPGPQAFQIGTALVYVFLAYGGWSDAATLSAEMRDRERGMRHALVYGMGAVTVLYLLVNWAYVGGLGLTGLAASEAPAADLARLAFGAPGELFIVAIVAVTSITSINALLIAGGRTTYAAARDTASLDRLRRWHLARGTPSAAIVAMAIMALALVGFGAVTGGGFATMVDYLSPVYWLFLTSSGIAQLVLRRRYPDAERPFRVPFHPVVPLLFVASSASMVYASLAYVRVGAIAGVGVLLAGMVLLALLRRRSRRQFASRETPSTTHRTAP